MIPYRIKGLEFEENQATQHSQSMACFLKKVFIKENAALIDLPEWSQWPCTGSKTPRENEVNNDLLYSDLVVHLYY